MPDTMWWHGKSETWEDIYIRFLLPDSSHIFLLILTFQATTNLLQRKKKNKSLLHQSHCTEAFFPKKNPPPVSRQWHPTKSTHPKTETTTTTPLRPRRYPGPTIQSPPFTSSAARAARFNAQTENGAAVDARKRSRTKRCTTVPVALISSARTALRLGRKLRGEWEGYVGVSIEGRVFFFSSSYILSGLPKSRELETYIAWGRFTNKIALYSCSFSRIFSSLYIPLNYSHTPFVIYLSVKLLPYIPPNLLPPILSSSQTAPSHLTSSFRAPLSFDFFLRYPHPLFFLIHTPFTFHF